MSTRVGDGNGQGSWPWTGYASASLRSKVGGCELGHAFNRPLVLEGHGIELGL
jgi:hypothetical protein